MPSTARPKSRTRNEVPARRTSVRRLALATLAALGAWAAAACTTHQCDASRADAGGGIVTSSGATLTWQSAPAGGPWLDFPGNATVTFHYPAGFRCATDWQAYVSTAQLQGDGGGTFVEASGQLAELSMEAPDGITVTNATCAEYFLYVVAHAPSGGCTPAGAAERSSP